MPDPALALGIALAILALGALVLHPDQGLLARWRKARPRPADVLRQDALKVVLQSELDLRPLTRADLAARLSLDQDAADTLIEGLIRSGHLGEIDGPIRLTAQGREHAARIVRAHRLWERHLADDTGFTESEWHAQAERVEHQLTPAETEALARRLGHPARDPHGDPIPTADGEVVAPPGMPLSAAPPGSTARITHVEDEPPEVYARLVALGLVPGTIVRRRPDGPEVVVLQVQGEVVRIPASAADNLAVVPVAAEPTSGRSLSDLRPGEQGIVVEISPRCRGAERRRMLDLGILPGTKIEAVMTSPAGDPTAYRIRDALIALRQSQAILIRITEEAT